MVKGRLILLLMLVRSRDRIVDPTTLLINDRRSDRLGLKRAWDSLREIEGRFRVVVLENSLWPRPLIDQTIGKCRDGVLGF